MDSKIRIHPLVGQAESLHQQVVATETTVETRVISLSTRDTLFHQLSQNQQDLGHLKEKIASGGGAFSDFEKARIKKNIDGLDKRIVHLYHRIQNLAIDNEIAEITQEAKELETTLEQGDLEKVAKAVSHLDEHIQTFTHDYAPGREGRHAIAQARATKQKANFYLQAHGLHRDTTHLFNQFNLLELPAKAPTSLDSDEIQAELVLELFDVAECFFNGKTKEGFNRFNQLSEHAKQRFRSQLALLSGSLVFSIADGVKYAQALIATAHDLADSSDGETHLTEAQLTTLFKEAHSVCDRGLDYKSRAGKDSIKRLFIDPTTP